MTDPHRPYVGVGCIVERDGKLLLMRRHGSHGHRTWSTPGGYLESGESFEDCAARETLEETGLVVTDISYFGVTNDIFPEEKRHFVTIWMRAGSATGEPTGSEESTEIGWFDAHSLPEPCSLHSYDWYRPMACRGGRRDQRSAHIRATQRSLCRETDFSPTPVPNAPPR